ncbi:MAG TPA: GNAT family N-acetyltransferase [Halococcus sp.]|nr:GNAT family N-acetyltransferase [Halococcus sp.]
MDFDVRQATRDDGETLLDLWHGFTAHLSEYDERYGHEDTADERWISYFENQLLDSKYGTVIVAEADDEPVGVLEARVMGNHPLFRLENHGKIHGLYVAEEYRGHGIASALFDGAVEWLTEPPREVDFYRITAIEGDDDAEEVYRANGCAPVEHIYEKRFD